MERWIKTNLNGYRDGILAKMPDNQIFPVRVIDLKDTIESKGGVAFTEPKDWNFHTISHTWSKDIRGMSEMVGKEVKAQTKLAYKEVFKGKSLGDQPGYPHLIEFLQILQGDGVERVWFDALCINQVDNEEKSHEILHMGAFYCHSLGCYVTAHGLGRGFGLTEAQTGAEAAVDLPRWFSRVWTLQEFLVPRRLTFVVELGMSEFCTLVSSISTSHVEGECSCGRSKDLGLVTTPQLLREGSHAGRVADANFWQVLESSQYKCTNGRFQRVKVVASSSNCNMEQGLYFVDRNAYAGIYMLVYAKDGDSKKRQNWLRLWRRLYRVLTGGPPGVVEEISVRDCSNEEDRVLSVLGVLGLDGKLQQLRTGQTLYEQIVQMCDALAKFDLETLIRLCASFVAPFHNPRLSWAPHFTSTSRQNFQPLHAFRPLVGSRSANVSPSGGLSLECYVLKGKLLSLLQHEQQCTEGGSSGCNACSSVEAALLAHQPESLFVLEIFPGLAILLFSSTANQEIYFKTIATSAKLSSNSQPIDGGMMQLTLGPHVGFENVPSHKIKLDVWLLLLGSVRNQFPYSPGVVETYLVFMACVGDNRENLHKIGRIRIFPISRGTMVPFDTFTNMKCTVGGCGKRAWEKWILEKFCDFSTLITSYSLMTSYSGCKHVATRNMLMLPSRAFALNCARRRRRLIGS